MPKVTSPRGEAIAVRRRWFPWPHFTTQAQLEEWGLASSAAQVLGRGHRGDWVLVAALAFIPLMLLLSGMTTIFTVLLVLTLLTLAVCYLALPWRIEVLHEGMIVESEKSDGYARTTDRIEKVAALYRSGALKLPAPPPAPEPSIRTAVPMQEVKRVRAPRRPDDDGLPTLEELDALAQPAPEPAPAPAPEPVRPTPTPPPAPVKRYTGESALRRAIRLMEEEEQALAAQGVTRPEVDPKVVKRAAPRAK